MLNIRVPGWSPGPIVITMAAMKIDGSIVLASASPRRRQLLEGLKIPFQVMPARVEEQRKEGESPVTYARRAALEKGEEVLARLSKGGSSPWILSADTIVVLGDEVLQKPRDAGEARWMLARLSNHTHTVITAWALGRADREWRIRTAKTEVTFHDLSTEQMDRYVATGEGMDKAGAYAIQGVGAFLVDRIEGNYYNVVGLPVSHVLQALVTVGALTEFP